jgi:transcriptional regulator with XRE-family HTH domain
MRYQNLRQFHEEILFLRNEQGWSYNKIAKHFSANKSSVEWIIKNKKNPEEVIKNAEEKIDPTILREIKEAKMLRIAAKKKKKRFEYIETPENTILPKGVA